MDSKRNRTKKELDQIKKMQSIKDVIDRGSSENMLLYTSSRENESLNDDVVDGMLNQMVQDKRANKDIDVIENLTAEVGGRKVVKSKKTSMRSRPGKSSVKRRVHIVKVGRSRSAVGAKAGKPKGRKGGKSAGKRKR